jgi:hypothetical protein
MIIIFPRGVNDVAVLTTTSPVTQTALTDVNRESRNVNGIVCALGIINSPEPIRIITKKLAENSKAGGTFIELTNLENTDISEIAIRKIPKITGIFPLKNTQKGFILAIMLKDDKNTKNENRNTTISKTNDIDIFLLL